VKDELLLGHGISIPEHANYFMEWAKRIGASIERVAFTCLDTLGRWCK
jgi:hypothetical protein